MLYRGFDTSAYPGDATMAALKPLFDFVGYYLPAPSHPERSWVGRRAALTASGWGLLPIYVGQESIGPGSHVLTAQQGLTDGVACADAMTAEGFAPGSRVFLDLENGPPFGKAEAEYVTALLGQVNARGFVAGVYCSHALADTVFAAEPGAPAWCFKVPTTARTVATPPFDPPDPSGCGYAAAEIWQYRQNCVLEVAGKSLLIDLDSARIADPSAPV